LIVALALLSHLATALLVHAPMAYASMSAAAAQPAAVAAEQPCPDHAKMAHGAAAVPVSDASHMAASSAVAAADHHADCKGGLCKCPCAHAQALTVMPMLTPAFVSHSPVVSAHHDPLAPDCATSFFRPPI
jgi:hypothetical protein